MDSQTTADDESQMDNSEQTILLGGGEKNYEDDFFLTGPKVNIASLKSQVGTVTEHAHRNLRDSSLSIRSNLLSDTGTGTVKFKSWHNNFCLQLVILLVILFVIIFIFIIIIHKNFS